MLLAALLVLLPAVLVARAPLCRPWPWTFSRVEVREVEMGFRLMSVS
jgi:hypothetical protein